MSDHDKTKEVSRPLLDAQMLVEMSSYAKAGEPEAMIASLVGAIVIVADGCADPDGALLEACNSLKYARVLFARKKNGVAS